MINIFNLTDVEERAKLEDYTEAEKLAMRRVLELFKEWVNNCYDILDKVDLCMPVSEIMIERNSEVPKK